MVWEPKNELLVFARICFPVLLPDFLASCCVPEFVFGIFSRQNTFHNRRPMQSRDPALGKARSTIEALS